MTDSDMIGLRVGHYRIVEEISRGRWGVVYRADDEVLHCDVAIKRLRPLDELARNEARTLARMNHPAIVVIHELISIDPFDYIVMQFVPGKTLQATLEGRPLRERKALRLGVQLAQGLAAAHAAGVIHRDLSAGNLLVTPDGWLKIIDFGLAKRTPRHGSSDFMAEDSSDGPGGTLEFVAPEVWRGEQATPAADVYAAGVILYQMVTGQTPFHSLGDKGIATATLTVEPPPPRVLNPRVSAGLDATIMRCLRKDPDRRMPAGELAKDLERLQRRKPALPRGIVVTGLAVLALAAILPSVVPRPEPPEIRSLAVLPFKNLTGDPAQTFLADGMTDELITKLGEQESLRVISGWSSSRVDTSLSIPEIGRRLNVQGLVEGSVTSSGDRLKFSARLIVARDDRRVWSDDHAVRTRDVLHVANRFAKSILKEIRLRPGSAQAEPVDPVAYQLYQLGRLQWNRRTEDGVRASIEYFRRAIGRDSLYAEAYSGLADAWTTAGHMGLDPPREAYARAKEAALQALALDSTLSEGYVSLANLRQNFDWDWAGAERDFQRAIEINDNNVVAHHWYSNLLAYRGDFARAREEIQYARELDPLSTSVSVGAGACEYLARRYDRALETLQHVVEADSSSELPYRVLAGTYYQLGRRAETANAIGRWIAIKYPPLSAVAAQGYRRAGLPGMSQALIDVMASEKRKGHYVPATHLAELAIGAGDLEAALRWLEVGWSEHDTELNRLKVDPIFDPLRGNPRFAELLRKVHLDS